MRIRALANGNVIEASDEAAKQLIEAKIYEDAGDEPVTATLTPPVPQNNSTQPPTETKPAAKRRPKAR